MAVLNLKDSGGYLHFDYAQCRAEGAKRAAAYQSAEPFPHIVIDDLLDADILRRLVAQFPDREGRAHFDRAQERLKFQFDPNTVSSPLARNLLAELNAAPFLGFLSELTGIKGLISDPYYIGGGLHETLSGGHLSVHADFNVHGHMQVERRLNLLIYLNDAWQESWNGALELWDRQMKAMEVSVMPVIGRAVIFSTSLDSFHGVPDALATPPDRARRSIATYYYTALPTESSLPARNTVFKPRPESGEKRDWRVSYTHFVDDWVPPRLRKLAMKVLR